MKPYYKSDSAVIYHADSRDVLPTLDRNAVLITDPPYGVDIDYKSYDDSAKNLESIIRDIWPVICGYRLSAATTGVKHMYLYPKYDWVLCWFTPSGFGVGPWGFCTWQPILVWGKDPFLQASKGSMPDVFAYNDTSKHAAKNGHPVPKPLDVMKWLIRRLTIKPETIIDPFMGSGTTLLAAQELGHRVVGIEIDEEYCEIAANQLEKGIVGQSIDGMHHARGCKYPSRQCVCEAIAAGRLPRAKKS